MQHLAAPANDLPGSGAVTILQWDVLNVDHNAAKLLFQFHNNLDGGASHAISRVAGWMLMRGIAL